MPNVASAELQIPSPLVATDVIVLGPPTRTQPWH